MPIVLLAEIWISVLSNKSSKVNDVASKLSMYKMLRCGKKTRYKYNQRKYIRMPIIVMAITCLISGATSKIGNKQQHKAYKTISTCCQRILSYTGQVDPIADTSYDEVYSNAVRFDTDSYPIKIDNCCTQTMSGLEEDFISSTLVSINGKHVIGFANTKTTITHEGIVEWRITDDNGVAHNINIPNSYLVPGCGI
jgi:hypothetical protein